MIGFAPFKGRKAVTGMQYDIYRNLPMQQRTGQVVWSIREPGGLVVGHASRLALADGVPHVNEAAQARIAAGAAREVHAFVRGVLLPGDPIWAPYETNRVTYEPHTAPWFFYACDKSVWQGGVVVQFTDRGMFS